MPFMKAALYARISTDEQRKESIDDQLRECPALADRLSEVESKLAIEAGSATVDGSAGEVRTPRSLEFYEQFVATIAKL